MNIPQEFIKKYGLRKPAPPVRRRLVVTGEGEPGSGKSDFIFRTAPRPILKVNLDLNVEGIEERYEDEDILIHDVKMPVEINQDADLELFKRVRGMILGAIEKDYFRTISIDTGDALYELCRRGFLGVLGFGEAKQSDFDVVNSNMRRFFRAAKERRVNLYVAHRREDEYKDKVGANGKRMGQKTGKRKMRGWKDTQFEAQCHVLFEKDLNWIKGNVDEADWDTYGRLGKFTMTILKCTANESVEGRVFRGEEISFPMLGTTVFPASDWKEWE